MAFLEDPIVGRALVGLLIALIAGAWFFGVDLILLLTRRRFGHINIELAEFSRREYKSTTNVLKFRSIMGNVPLQQILRSRPLFWYVVWCSITTPPEDIVVEFSSHKHAVLSRVRTFIAERFASMEIKRYSGLPFTVTPSQLCFIVDRAEDKKDRHKILRVIIMPEEVLDGFLPYFFDPPKNTRNWEIAMDIHEAYALEAPSFTFIEIPAA